MSKLRIFLIVSIIILGVSIINNIDKYERFSVNANKYLETSCEEYLKKCDDEDDDAACDYYFTTCVSAEEEDGDIVIEDDIDDISGVEIDDDYVSAATENEDDFEGDSFGDDEISMANPSTGGSGIFVFLILGVSFGGLLFYFILIN